MARINYKKQKAQRIKTPEEVALENYRAYLHDNHFNEYLTYSDEELLSRMPVEYIDEVEDEYDLMGYGYNQDGSITLQTQGDTSWLPYYEGKARLMDEELEEVEAHEREEIEEAEQLKTERLQERVRVAEDVQRKPIAQKKVEKDDGIEL